MMLDDINLLRRRGVRVLVAASWANTVAVTLISLIAGTDRLLPLALIGILANLLPTVMVRQGRADAQARLVVASLAAVQPALIVYALSGHGWQMDGHMYFFVALAGLTVLCACALVWSRVRAPCSTPPVAAPMRSSTTASAAAIPPTASP